MLPDVPQGGLVRGARPGERRRRGVGDLWSRGGVAQRAAVARAVRRIQAARDAVFGHGAAVHDVGERVVVAVDPAECGAGRSGGHVFAYAEVRRRESEASMTSRGTRKGQSTMSPACCFSCSARIFSR